MSAVLTYEPGEGFMPLGGHSYAWVSVKRFGFDPRRSDLDLLRALLGHEQFHDSYGAPEGEGLSDSSIHGPYQLAALTPESYELVEPAQAARDLRAWAEDFEINELAAVRLEEFLEVFTADAVFRLVDPGHHARHAWGFVVGSDNGFHEYVAVDRQRCKLSLVIASDD